MRKYEILILDHYHYMDRDSQYCEKETHDTPESAVFRAKTFLDQSLSEYAKPGMSASDIFGMWASWGESPLIVARHGAEPARFNAREYARSRAETYVVPADIGPQLDEAT